MKAKKLSIYLDKKYQVDNGNPRLEYGLLLYVLGHRLGYGLEHGLWYGLRFICRAKVRCLA